MYPLRRVQPFQVMDDGLDEAASVARLLHQHDWIARCWLSAFIVDGAWDRLPDAWRRTLLELSDEGRE